MPPSDESDDPVPIFGSWPRIYAAVIASAVAWIALGIWTSLLPRPAPPEPSPHHIRAEQAPPPARDACTFVAGVRHCPSAQPR